MIMTKENEVVSKSPLVLPVVLKFILRYTEKVMAKEFSISFQLPVGFFSINLESCDPLDNIIDIGGLYDVSL